MRCASDTAHHGHPGAAIARQRELRERLADDEATPLAILGGFCLWLLRLRSGAVSTPTGSGRGSSRSVQWHPGARLRPRPWPPPAAAALPAGQLRTSPSMGCPFCTVLDREADGRCAGCGATGEQRAQAVLAAELDRALRARGGDRRRQDRSGGRGAGGRDWDALSRRCASATRARGSPGRPYESGADLGAGEGAPVMIAVFVLCWSPSWRPECRWSRCRERTSSWPASRRRRWRFWRWPSCAGWCGWGGGCRGTGRGCMRWRLRLGLRPGPDHANCAELVWRWGRFAAWRRSRMARPSLGTWRRYLGPVQHSHLVGWAYGWHPLWVPFEEHSAGHGAAAAAQDRAAGQAAQRWPGPAVATSTKPDLFGLTSRPAAAGGPVLVFNPQGLGGLPSSFAWSPLEGGE